jgi:hypothetical protein
MATVMPRTKLSRLLEYMAAADWHSALRLAAKFPQLGAHKAAITRAWNAIQSPQFYRELGQDPDALIAAGVAALKERYERKE